MNSDEKLRKTQCVEIENYQCSCMDEGNKICMQFKLSLEYRLING